MLKAPPRTLPRPLIVPWRVSGYPLTQNFAAATPPKSALDKRSGFLLLLP